MSETILAKMIRAEEAEQSFKRQAKDKELVHIRQNEKGEFVDYDNHPFTVKPIGEPFIVRFYTEATTELQRYWSSYTEKIVFPESLRRIGVVIGKHEFLRYGSNEMFCAVQLYLILQD